MRLPRPTLAAVCVFLVASLGLLVLPATAQELTTYEDPAGRFTVTVPTGWIDESTDEAAIFTSDTGATATIITAEADDVAAGIDAALTELSLELGDPASSNEIPLPGGAWTQNIYVQPDGSVYAALGHVEENVAYVLVFYAPDQPTLAATTPDLNTMLLGFTIGEAVDLTGQMPAAFDEAMVADLEAYIVESMDQYEIPGASVAVVQDGEVVYVNGFGVTSLEAGQPVDANTLFMIGSTTKSMTTLMMGTLVDDGLLDWDTPVTEILPSFTLSVPEATAEIEVRDLVNNSSGVPRWDLPLLLDFATVEEVFAAPAEIPMAAAPGEEFNYSNFMVATGGFVAALAAGAELGDDVYQTYIDLVNERVFEPIGMESTTFNFEAALASPNHAMPYSYQVIADELLPVPLDFERFVLPIAPAGAAWSNADDMAQYMITLLNEGVAPDGMRIISEENLAETQTPQIAVFGNDSYGMGWFIGSYNGLLLINHGGNTAGFTSDFAYLPEAELGVLVLTNKGISNNFNQSIREYVFEQAFGLEHTADAYYASVEAALTGLFEEAYGTLELEPVDADAVADLLGTYEFDVTLELDGDELILTTEFGELPLRAIAGEPNAFLSIGALEGSRVTFEENDGVITLRLAPVVDLEGSGQYVEIEKVS